MLLLLLMLLARDTCALVGAFETGNVLFAVVGKAVVTIEAAIAIVAGCCYSSR